MYEIKTEDLYEDFSKNKELFDFSSYLAKSKYYDDSSKLVVSKMKDETDGVAIKGFVGLKPNMYSFLVDDSSEHEKAKGMNKNIVETIGQSEYKNVLLNKKFLTHSMNRSQSKYNRIRSYEINKISLSCFDDKIHILNNRYDGLALVY